MDTGIGATLREARGRRKLDLAEVEAAIKIRARYLRAMENEEWDALPGGAYTRGFIRTYASYLGLDGERLADDFRRATTQPGGERAPKRVEPVQTGARRRPRIPGGLLVALVSLLLIGVVVAIGLAGGGDDPPAPAPAPELEENGARSGGGDGSRQARPRPEVAMRLVATGEVWVCLVDAAEQPLVEGRILEPGAEEGPFRSRGFAVALGNGSADLVIDGKRTELPPSSSPVGYAVDARGRLTELEEGERPSCE